MEKKTVNNWDALPIVLNVSQMAALMGCGQQAIREMCHAKMIPYIRMGHSSVPGYMNRHKRNGLILLVNA